MRFIVLLITVLFLSGSVSAECRDKECMPNERIVTDADRYGPSSSGGFSIYYDNVFEIGTNWFVIFEYGSQHNGLLEFNFGNGVTKNLTLFNEGGIIKDSVSFSGSTFDNEEPHKRLYVNFSTENGAGWSVELDIFVNKPPADDLFYLWAGMTVFWVSIGAYVLYISTKLGQLIDK